MKRLALLILIVTLPILTYFQYQKYRRFHPPVDYDYTPSDSIDSNYHDPVVLQQYYQNVYEIGRFARSQWRSQRVDVRYPQEGDPEEKAASQYYQQLLSATALLEDRLVASQRLKERGFDNQAIVHIEQEGWSPQNYWLAQQAPLKGLQKGDKGSGVWALQKLLVNRGYEIPVDGIFSVATEEAVKDLQQTTGNYPSGEVDDLLLQAMMKP